jgi:choice-of-anchor B domain-containing protein
MHRTQLIGLILAGVLLATVAEAQSPPENVVLLKHLDRGENYSGNWGYTAPNGTELAISGTASGTSFINATDPSNAHEVAFIPGPGSTWREMATYEEYCYIVTEEPGAALQVVSLANPLQPTLVATLNPPAFFYATAHEIKIDQQTGYCYVAGTNPATGQPARGLVILDLNANPTNPPMRGNWTLQYVHDLSIKDGKAYCACINNGRIYVLDVTQPGTPPVVGTPWTWPNPFPHNTWPSDDGSLLVTTDENTGGHLRVWNINNLSQVTQLGEWISPTGAIVHNAYLRGNICYMSHYRDGLRVVDVSNPANPQPVGWYDTHPGVGSGFSGAWGCYCYAADPSIVYITDIQTGTYILQFTSELGTIQGTVRDANNQVPIAGAEVEIVGVTDITVNTNGQGFYSAVVGSGDYTVNCSIFGYEPATAPASVVTGQTTTLDFNLVPLASGSLTGVVQSTSLAPIAGAQVAIGGTPLLATTDVNGVYNFATVPAGSYDVSAAKFGFASETLPVIVSPSQQATLDFNLTAAYFAADMEASPGAWTVSGNATTGQWVRVNPNGTGGGLVQPEDDHTPAPGVICWVTGQGAPGGGIGDADIDNGSTTLTTHVFDLSPLVDPILNYWRWFVNDGNGTNDDPWVVEVSSNGGTSWVAIENTFVAQAFWREITIRVTDYVTPNSQFQVRFTARDLNPGSIVEAGVDDFQIYEGEETTGIPPTEAPLASGPVLIGNYPNPFNPSTAIRFDLAQPTTVKLRIFDAAGRTVRMLVDGPLAAGRQSVSWDGRNQADLPMASGVYYYQLEAPGFSESRSLVLAK